jgi:hypothetical protein
VRSIGGNEWEERRGTSVSQYRQAPRLAHRFDKSELR